MDRHEGLVSFPAAWLNQKLVTLPADLLAAAQAALATGHAIVVALSEGDTLNVQADR